MEKEIEMEREAIQIVAGGAVNSVNGMTGDVVLTTSDLENTSDYQTGDEVDATVAAAVVYKQDILVSGENIKTINGNSVLGSGDLTIVGGVSSVNGETGDVVLTTSDLTNDSDYQTGTEVASAISTAVSAEAGLRTAADNNLQTQIDAISASSDVKDIVGTKAELNNYDTSTLNNNDIIKVLSDESEDDATTYYRWNATTQQFTLIGEEGPYYTKAQTDTLLDDKQDTLTAGANITIDANNEISATDTTYTHFTGATASTDGTQGLVPGPLAGDEDKYLKADGTWATVDAGPTVVQTTGNSTTDIMSQNATTSMVYADPGNGTRIRIGSSANLAGSGYPIVIGTNSMTNGEDALTLGTSAASTGRRSIALGAYSNATQTGQLDVSTGSNPYGYNSSNYRLLTGLYDPQSDHDAATKGYVDTAVAGAGGGVTELTSADYNYDDSSTGTDNCVALWLLEPGVYTWATGVRIRWTTTAADYTTTGGSCQITTPQSVGGPVGILLLVDTVYRYVKVNSTTGLGASTSVILTGSSVVQSTGTSTTNIMSQNATTGMVFADPSSRNIIQIGNNASAPVWTGDAIAIGSGAKGNSSTAIAIGKGASASGVTSINIGYPDSSASTAGASGISSIAIGRGANATAAGSVAIGADAKATTKGVFSIGASSSYGYNSTNYRLLSGLYDGQSAHDAATYGQLNTRMGGLSIVSITQTDYDDLATKDPDTLYVITGA